MWWTSLKRFLRTYNAFPEREGNDIDEYQIRTQILSTRIYLILLFASLLALILTKSLAFGTARVISLEQPSLHQFNALNNPQCPCSNVAIPYSVFMSIEPQFHSVCSSDFVTSQWIDFLNQKDNDTYYWPFDFRASASSQFQSLASFCILSRTLIEQDLAQFLTTSLISIQAISSSALEFQIEAAANEFKSNTLNLFNRQRYLIEQMIVSNQLLSGQETNFIALYFHFADEADSYAVTSRLFYTQTNTSPACSCRNGDCQILSGFYDPVNASTLAPDTIVINPSKINLQMAVPGLIASCYPVQSILLSTLECFYDQSCVNNFISFIPLVTIDPQYRPTVTALKITTNSSTRLTPNSTIETLVRNLMIERWTIVNTSHENYYDTCAPVSCTHSIIQRNDFFDIFTTFVSFYGGLTIVLRILVPWIVKRFRKRQQEQQHPPPLPLLNYVGIRLRELFAKAKQFFINLNIFRKDSDDWNDVQLAIDQRLSTRLFLVILVGVLCALSAYSYATLETRQQTVYQPTESQVNDLQNLHPISLTCPCVNSSIPYNAFISVEPQFHQICSSIFIDTPWIALVITSSPILDTIYTYYYFDFRVTAGNFFQTLQTLCHFAEQTISDSQYIFLETKLLSTQLIEQSIIESKSNVSINDWKTATVNTFVRDQLLIRVIIQGNQIMAGHLSNYDLDSTFDGQVTPFSKPIPMQDPQSWVSNQSSATCLCALNQACAWQSYISDFNHNGDATNLYIMPGIFAGCYQINAVLQSTLECLYNKTCINIIQVFFTNVTDEFSFPPLNSTLNSINETIESIINRLMVDHWLTNINYSAYFKACAPLFCTFEYTQHHTFTYLITTIVGIFGGLTKVLQFLIPLVVKFYRRIRRRADPSPFTFCQRIRTFLISYNLFFRINSNEFQLRVQRQMTRFYVIILIISLITVFLLLSLPLGRKIVLISSPSYANYRELSHISNLQCSCSHLTIPYSSFFFTKMPSFHEVCSSDFVTQRWTSLLFSSDIDQYVYDATVNYHVTEYPPTDFRSIGTYQFQLLAGFCQLVNSTISAALEQLTTQDFVNALLLTELQFNNQITSLFDQLKQTTATMFIASLRLIRAYMHNNALFTISASNWQFDPGSRIWLSTIHTKPVVYTTNCSCALTPLCVQPAVIDDNVTLPGLMVGCFPLESLFQSTLEVLYNQTLIDLIANSSDTTFTALTTATRYQRSITTVESILSQLMVEQWETAINLTSYENYYAQCSPSLCTYTYHGRREFLDCITSLIAFAGGLTVSLNIIMPLLIKLVEMIKRRRIRIRPITQ